MSLDKYLLTPLQLWILVHYYAVSHEDYRDGDVSSPAVPAALDRFIDLRLLENILQQPDDMLDPVVSIPVKEVKYRITERGRVHMHRLLDYPLPVEIDTPRWVSPPVGV